MQNDLAAPAAVKKVVIAGGGTAGWMAAMALSTQFGELLDITLVESEEIGTIGVGESTVPPIVAFHDLLGIDERDFMRECAATFKVGIWFENWARIGDRYMHPFGRHGQATWMAEFYNFWLHARLAGLEGADRRVLLRVAGGREGQVRQARESAHQLRLSLRRGAVRALPAPALRAQGRQARRGQDQGGAHARRQRLRRSRSSSTTAASSTAISSSTAPAFAPCSSKARSRPATRTGCALAALRQRGGIPDHRRRTRRSRTPPATRTRPAGAGTSRCSIASATAWCSAAATCRTTRRAPSCSRTPAARRSRSPG